MSYHKKIAILLTSILLLSSIFVVGIVSKSHEAVSADNSNNIVENSEQEVIYVEIKGAVLNPGVYKLEKPTRLFELLELAGGLLEGANIEYINQTKILEDQMVVVILTNEQIASNIAANELKYPEESQIVTVDQQISNNGSDFCYCNSTQNTKLNLNTATKEQLMTINGIGEVKADAIIAYRNNTPFTKVEDLLNVTGIGNASFEKIKDYFTV